MNNNLDINDRPELLKSTFGLIDLTRHFIAKTINQELTLWYWKIEKSINDGFYKRNPHRIYLNSRHSNCTSQLCNLDVSYLALNPQKEQNKNESFIFS